MCCLSEEIEARSCDITREIKVRAEYARGFACICTSSADTCTCACVENQRSAPPTKSAAAQLRSLLHAPHGRPGTWLLLKNTGARRRSTHFQETSDTAAPVLRPPPEIRAGCNDKPKTPWKISINNNCGTHPHPSHSPKRFICSVPAADPLRAPGAI